jgi:type IV secretory pathway VirB10-like protein
MAWDLSKLNFFSRLDARSRVFFLLAIVIGFVLLIYVGTKYFTSGTNTLGPSQVANAPAGLQSTPGVVAPTAEYQNAMRIANQQRSEIANKKGGSSIPTQINTSIPTINTTECVVCEAQAPNVKNLLDTWGQQAKVGSDVAKELETLASKDVLPEEYAAQLDKLVKEGKLTPEQARLLLEEYKKQHVGDLLKDSAKTMDNLIKSGQLPLDVANELLNDQKNGTTPTQYAAKVRRLAQEGKISPAVAQQLLAQYSKQCLQEASTKHIGLLEQMASNGAITQSVVKQLAELTKRDAPLNEYNSALNGLVSGGNLTPDASAKLVNAYQEGKSACGVASSTLDTLVKQAENAAYQEIRELLAANKITQDVAAQLNNMIQNNVSMDDYKSAVGKLVEQKKLTPQIEQLKVGDYEKVKQLRDQQQRLAALQANNVSPAQYAEELQRAVTSGVLVPTQAAQLMQDYQSTLATAAIPETTATGSFAALQQKVAAGAAAAPAPAITTGETTQFAAAENQAAQAAEQERQAQLQTLESAMAGQAQQLIAAWQSPVMEHKEGVAEPPAGKKEEKGEKGPASGRGSSSSERESSASGLSPLIKAGSIIFAVLDTAVNSDYPDTPVLATIVEGQFKGAKLLGKLMTAKGVSGQLDRISLNFTLMNFDPWDKSKSVTAYAIDPDTARTVLASEVNYHYMQKFGAIMATSFLQGYASGITNAGTSTTGIFGTSTTHPELSPGNKLMVGLGQMGQTLGNATQNYVNVPPTVRVDSGVSLGILFMSDLS